ncbi:MAG: DUF3800 domain-containing protein [Desulfobaccales bacterium]
MSHKEYLEHLWFVMQHSDDPERLTLAVSCYLDESGIDQHNPHAVVAGIVFRRERFIRFDSDWNDILSKFKIDPPIHMKEFGKHGRHGHLDYPTRNELFTELAYIINRYKILSVAITLNHEQYSNMLSDKTKKEVSLYGLCFMLCAHQCFAMASFNHYYGNMAFLMEEGNECAGHVRRAHKWMMQMRKEGATYISNGSLTFEPKELSPLQAADIIAWGVRRTAGNVPIIKGYEPITNIFNNRHVQNQYDEELLKSIEVHSGNSPNP